MTKIFFQEKISSLQLGLDFSSFVDLMINAKYIRDY